MRIRTLFLAALFAVASPGFAASTWIATEAGSRAATAGQAIELTQALGAVMRAMVATAVERGTLVTMTGGNGNLALLAKVGAAGQDARTQARAALTRIGTSPAALDANEAALTDLIHQVTAAAGQPRPDLTVHALAFPTALVNQFIAFGQTVQTRLVGLAPEIAVDTGLAQTLTALRAVAGLRNSTVQKAWVPGAVPTIALIGRMRELNGMVDQAWATSQALAATLPADSALAAAMDGTQKGFFGVADPRYRALVAQLANHAPPEGTAAALHAYSVHWLATLQRPRDAALAAALRIARRVQTAARLRLMAAALAALAGLALAFTGGLILWRRVVLALGRLTVTLGRLAGGALATEVPDRDRGDEIGAIAQAVETLRAGAAEANRLAAAAAAEQQAKLTEAQRLGALLAEFERGAGEATSGVAGAAVALKQTAASLGDLAHGARGEAGTIANGLPEPRPMSTNWPPRPRSCRPRSGKSRPAWPRRRMRSAARPAMPTARPGGSAPWPRPPPISATWCG